MKNRNFFNRLIISSAAAFVCWTTQAYLHAQDDDILVLDPFVVDTTEDEGYIGTRSLSGTRTNTLVQNMAQSMTVLSNKFLEDLRPEKVGDALRYVSSATGRDERDDANIRIRGFGASVMLDSFIFSPGREASWDLANIDRLEVVKGASAVLYGSTPPGGLVSMERKQPLSDFAGSVTLEVGENAYYRAVGDVTGPLKSGDGVNVNYRAVVAYEDSESWRPFTDYKKYVLGLAADIIFQEGTNLLVRWDYQDFDGLQNFAQPFATSDDLNNPNLRFLNLPHGFFRGEPDDRKEVMNNIVSFDFKHFLTSEWVIRWFNAYLDSDADRRETFITAPRLLDDGTFLWDRFTQFIPRDTNDFYSEFQLTGIIETGGLRHEVLFGARHRNFTQDRANRRFRVVNQDGTREVFDLFNPTYGKSLGEEILGASRDQRIEQKEYGIYFQDTVKMLDDRLSLVLGIRYDHLDIINTNNITEETLPPQEEAQWSPRLGIVYSITDDITLYGSINESFLPSSGAGSFDGTPFDPPTAEQEEIGIRFNFLEDRASVSVAYFNLAQQNLTVSDPINPGFQIQTGELSSEGIEIDTRFQITEGLSLIAGYSSLEAIVSEDTNLNRLGNQLRGVPETNAYALARYDFADALEGLAVVFGYAQVGEAPFSDARDNPVMRPSYDVANLLIEYAWDRYKLSLDVDNLFDEEYFGFNGGIRFAVPGDKRWVKFQFTAEF